MFGESKRDWNRQIVVHQEIEHLETKLEETQIAAICAVNDAM